MHISIAYQGKHILFVNPFLLLQINFASDIV